MYKIQKIIFIALVLICINLYPTLAQKRASVGVSYEYGFTSYFFVSDININNDIVKSNFLPVNGYGIVFTYTDKLMGIQLGVKKIPKGWIENFQNGASAELLVDYLEVPILTHMRFNSKGKSGLILNYGLFASKATACRTTLIDSPNVKEDTLYINYDKPEYASWDYGIKGGLGYEFEIGRSSLQLQIMFTQGMRDLFEPDRTKLYKSLSQTLTAGVIYKFAFYQDKLKKRKKEADD